MSYDKLLYEAYGYQVDEAETDLRAALVKARSRNDVDATMRYATLLRQVKRITDNAALVAELTDDLGVERVWNAVHSSDELSPTRILVINYAETIVMPPFYKKFKRALAGLARRLSLYRHRGEIRFLNDRRITPPWTTDQRDYRAPFSLPGYVSRKADTSVQMPLDVDNINFTAILDMKHNKYGVSRVYINADLNGTVYDNSLTFDDLDVILDSYKDKAEAFQKALEAKFPSTEFVVNLG